MRRVIDGERSDSVTTYRAVMSLGLGGRGESRGGRKETRKDGRTQMRWKRRKGADGRMGETTSVAAFRALAAWI